ncbi:MAG: phosphatase PAP2 family protein [Melioribacteraceae bacterium]|nr:phosphatase PAP2 family protein [Melioribacteraceae bacterium]
MQKLFRNFYQTDLLVVAFYLIISLISIIFHYRIEQWYQLVILAIFIIVFVFWISNKGRNSKKIFWRNVHFYYVVPLIFISFKVIYVLVGSLHTTDYDNILIEIDRFLLGVDPTVFLYQYSSPVLTELLQIAYGTFFFLPIILGLEFHLKGEYKKFQFIVFSVVLGFFLSYFGYFIFPAVGPRFTLHDFDTTNLELPGLLLTNFLRDIVNAGESIPKGIANPIDFVQRDVFPSGHTQMTLIVIYLSYKLKSSYRLFFLIDGSLLIIATVYLRYHYVIDLFGGLIFMIATMYFGKKIYNWWQLKLNKEKFEY